MNRASTIKVVAVTLLTLLSAGNGYGQAKRESALWDRISNLFKPPAEYASQFGIYPSPLKFYNGKRVTTKHDWLPRRREIVEKWTSMLGQWPPILKGQHLKVLDTIRRENFTQHRVLLEWLPGNHTTGYLLIPDGKSSKPAVITVYYEPETAVGLSEHPQRDFAYQLAKRGFVTLSLGTSETTASKTYSLYYPAMENATMQPLSTLAYAAANAWEALAIFPGIDSTRIGIAGHSYGGKWAMFASCLYEKFACAAWSDPGIVFDNKEENANYWEPWYLGYHPPPWRKRGLITKENPARGAYVQMMREGHDITEIHALMAPRPFLVSGGSVDVPSRWIALNHAIAVNRLLGYENRVAMSNRAEHSPNAESNEMMYAFFEYFLKVKSQK